MATLADVQAHVASLAADEGKLVTIFNTVVTENTAQKQQIADLQAKLASGAVINQADLDALDASISTVDTAITAAIPAA
jgi:translation initiation factor 1 (eIF-1/SUI1)